MKTFLTILTIISLNKLAWAKSPAEDAIAFQNTLADKPALVEIFNCAFSTAHQNTQINKNEIEQIKKQEVARRNSLIISFRVQINNADSKILANNIIERLNIRQATINTCATKVQAAQSAGISEEEIQTTVMHAEQLGVATAIKSN